MQVYMDIQVYMGTCACRCVWAYMHTGVYRQVCMYICMQVCIDMCVCRCACRCVWACMQACMEARGRCQVSFSIAHFKNILLFVIIF